MPDNEIESTSRKGVANGYAPLDGAGKVPTSNISDTTPIEGTAIKSTGESGGTKYLREDGDGSCSWQTPSGSTDEKVKADATDPTAGFLDAKVDDTGIAVDATTHKLILKPVYRRVNQEAHSMSGEAGTFNGQACGAATPGVYQDFWYLFPFQNNPAPYTAEAVKFQTKLPPDYKDGSDIEVCITWAPNSTNTGNVKLQVGMRAVSAGDLLSVSETWQNFVQAAPGTSVQKVNNQVTFDGTGLVAGDDIALILFRYPGDAEDTFTGDVWIVCGGIKYESNRRGGVIA